MKILKTIRLIITAIMIGLSVMFPPAHKDESPKFYTEQRDKKDDDT